MTDTDSSNFDLVVVGSGIAGLSAAVTGAQMGQRVAVIERAAEGEHGGNTRYTESYMRMKSMDEVADDFESHFAENAGGYPDPGILQEAALDYDSWSSLMRAMCIADPEVIDAFAAAAGPTLALRRRSWSTRMASLSRASSGPCCCASTEAIFTP